MALIKCFSWLFLPWNFPFAMFFVSLDLFFIPAQNTEVLTPVWDFFTCGRFFICDPSCFFWLNCGFFLGALFSKLRNYASKIDVIFPPLLSSRHLSLIAPKRGFRPLHAGVSIYYHRPPFPPPPSDFDRPFLISLLCPGCFHSFDWNEKWLKYFASSCFSGWWFRLLFLKPHLELPVARRIYFFFECPTQNFFDLCEIWPLLQTNFPNFLA